MGGGSSDYFPRNSDRLQQLIRQTQESTEQLRLNADVGSYLERLLIRMNDRNPERTQRYLDEIVPILQDYQEIEKLSFGGSVAKHTFVDGLSDVDALVVLQNAELGDKTPQEVLKIFFDALEQQLARDNVAGVTVGKLAVTVTYRDGTEIQLLPAVRRGRDVCIADASGTDWKSINPRSFRRELTRANERMGGMLVPTIKLAKSALSSLPEDIRPTGYHVEALCLEAVKGYKGPRTLKSLLLHVLTASGTRVLRPIADITNQSKNVDEYLGRADSETRVHLGRAIAGIARRLNAATTADTWKDIVEG